MGSSTMRASPGRVGRGTPTPESRMETHVGRPETTEGDGPLQCGDHRGSSVDGL